MNAPATILDIGGSKYKLKAAIFHYGRTQFAGHYTAYVTVNNGWYLLDDTTTCPTRWPTSGKNAHVLFYEKISRR